MDIPTAVKLQLIGIYTAKIEAILSACKIESVGDVSCAYALVHEIVNRLNPWLQIKIPADQNSVGALLGCVSGTLYAEYDRLTNFPAVPETPIVKEELPAPIPQVRDEILSRYSILEEAIKRLTHSIEHAGQTCLPYIHELDKHLYWIALPTMDYVKESKMGYLARIRELLDDRLEELKKNHPSLVNKISPATLEEKILYLTKVMLNFPDDNSSEAIRAAFMESVNRKVASWHKFPTNSLLEFKSAVRCKCQELWH